MSTPLKHMPVQPSTPAKAKVQQHHADQANLNKLLARHMNGPNRLGPLPTSPNATAQPRFLDLSDAASYHDMLNRVTSIDSMFRRLPARIRGRFLNRPELLLAFCEDPANVKEAVKLRLIDDPEVIQSVLDAEARDFEAEAAKVGEEAPRADKEAQPPYTPRKGGNSLEGD